MRRYLEQFNTTGYNFPGGPPFTTTTGDWLIDRSPNPPPVMVITNTERAGYLRFRVASTCCYDTWSFRGQTPYALRNCVGWYPHGT